MSSTIKRGVTYNRYNREVEENWNPEDTETQEKELMNKYNRIENRDIDSKYFIKRQTYTLKQRQEPLRSSLDKYGLRRLSDTWESQRFKYGKNNTDEHNEERKQSKSRERSRSPIEGVNKPRPSTVLKSKLNESEDPRPQKYKTEIIREEPKIELEENKIKDHEIGTEIDEIIETPDQYYLVDANHPIFLESPSRLKKEGETNEETIKKYESILRDINYEFKQLLKRNKYLEMKLENELKQIEPKAEIIEALQQQINELKSERQHQLTVYKLEQDKFNKEIASLQYQLNVHQDREEKYKTEKTNLQFSIQNLEIQNAKMIENDKKNQREIVQLHERIANSENSSKIQDVVVANYNKLRDSYQVEISKESKRRESLENENNLLRKHLTEQAYTIEELNTQIESLKQTIYNQNLVIDSLKSTKIYVDEPTRDLAPIKFDAPTGGLPLFEPKLQADPYSSAIRTFSPERETQIVPSPTKLGSAQKRESLEYDFNGRAGVKSKKHCTIDCIFSNKPCDQCGKGKDLKSQLNLIFRP